jgi:hypothetical protein
VPFGFVDAQAEIERLAVEGLALSVDAGANTPASQGTWKGEPCVLEARRWSGPRVAMFRTVRLIGRDVEIVNVLGIAKAPLDAPILGIDLVAARADAGVVVADLSPLEPPSVPLQTLPEWARGIFSGAPLIARVEPSNAAPALQQVLEMTREFITRVRAASPAGDDGQWRGAVDRYRTGHLNDERMQAMLTHMFGSDRAASLMRDVLFPELQEADVHAR